jgi:5-methylcytosine-specific restriction endonuclease McrA
MISASAEFPIPAVMIYSKYIKIKRKKFPSKRAIRLRDKGQCGYCGLFLSPENLTIDHVVPISRFKEKSQANTWENQISCCWQCNNSKGNRTPQEAGMSMLFTPRRIDILFLLETIPQEWNNYL